MIELRQRVAFLAEQRPAVARGPSARRDGGPRPAPAPRPPRRHVLRCAPTPRASAAISDGRRRPAPGRCDAETAPLQRSRVPGSADGARRRGARQPRRPERQAPVSAAGCRRPRRRRQLAAEAVAARSSTSPTSRSPASCSRTSRRCSPTPPRSRAVVDWLAALRAGAVGRQGRRHRGARLHARRPGRATRSVPFVPVRKAGKLPAGGATSELRPRVRHRDPRGARGRVRAGRAGAARRRRARHRRHRAPRRRPGAPQPAARVAASRCCSSSRFLGGRAALERDSRCAPCSPPEQTAPPADGRCAAVGRLPAVRPLLPLRDVRTSGSVGR